MGKGIAYLVALIAGVLVVGWIAIQLLSNFFWVLVVGAVVIGGGALIYRAAKRRIEPGSRTAYRIEAAKQTYRMRNK